MDFKEMLRKISLPLKTKENDRNILKEEELYIEEVQMLVFKYSYIIFIFFFSIVKKIIILFQSVLKQKKKMLKMQIMAKCLWKNMVNKI